MTENLEYMVCPEGHKVPFRTEAFAKDFSDNDRDAVYNLPMSEPGLYCHICDRAYGLSKLKEE